MDSKLTPDNRKNLESLIQKISQDECCIFVGAGLSIPAGYPNWEGLVTTLKQAAEINTGCDPCDPELSNWDKAEFYRETLGEERYREQIIDLFSPDGKEDYRSIHRVIMEIPFHAYITTNYDYCLENAASSLGKSIRVHFFPELDPSYLRTEDAFHIHGVLNPDNPHGTVGTFILTERDYREAYRLESSLPNFLASLFWFHTLVFIGYSMNDNDLIKVFQSAQLELSHKSKLELEKGIGKRKQNRHFIFLHQDGNVRMEAIREMGLIPIFYGGETVRHTELNKLLDFILRRTTEIQYPKPEMNRDMFEVISDG